jgi:hypothetical protein
VGSCSIARPWARSSLWRSGRRGSCQNSTSIQLGRGRTCQTTNMRETLSHGGVFLVAIYLEDFQVAALQLANKLRHGGYVFCRWTFCRWDSIFGWCGCGGMGSR